MKLLFVYGFAPSGHASAAKALETQARALGHETSCLDISADYHRILGPAINNIYLALIQSFPNLWTTIHDNESAADILGNWRKIYHLFEGHRLRSTIQELKPDRIVCTHAGPFAALTLAKEKGELPAPLAGVVTDFRPHPYWAVPGADLYITASKDASRMMVERGIPAKLLRDSGIPVHPAFGRAADREAERRALGLKPKEPALLLSGGSRGLGRLAEAAEALLKALPNVRLVAVCGSNEALKGKLDALASPRLTTLGLVDAARMRALMAACDLLVGKAGGLTSAECLAAGLPLVVLDPIPGQEFANAEFLERAGAAVLAGDPEALPTLIKPLLAPKRLASLKKAAAALGRPEAGRLALEAILS